MKLKAYAKINLTLDVLSKRADGYHEIDSVMQSVSLYDELTAEKSDGILLKCDNAQISNADNIIYKAATAFFDYTGISGGVSVKLKKNIPLLSGLGGGSSDAAAVIKALNILYKTELSEDELIKIGLKVGADVPFCLIGSTARVRGIGERVTPVKHLSGYSVVLLKNGEKQSTGKMYSLIDEIPDRTPLTEKFLSEMSCPFKYTGNDFLGVSGEKDTVALLERFEPLCASLSGSGPTVFAVFENGEKADFAANTLKSEGFSPILCKFI